MPEVTILYAAFAVVALWLLGELLLQRRAPLHWRALALLGFLGLVAGVTQRSLPLIGVGVLAFGAGQFLATQAVKKGGGATHWSLVAPESVPVVGRLFAGEEQAPAPASQGRSRRAGGRPVEAPEPVAVPVVEPVPVGAVEATAVFQADEYAVEGDSVYYAQTEQDQHQAAYYAYTAEQQVAYADPYPDPYAQQYAGYEQQQYQEYAQYQQYPEQQYGQQPGQQQPGQQPYGQQQYASYEQQSYDQHSYDPQQYQQQYGAHEQTPYYAADPQQQHAPQG